jgi:hypothetical protein
VLLLSGCNVQLGPEFFEYFGAVLDVLFPCLVLLPIDRGSNDDAKHSAILINDAARPTAIHYSVG